MAIVTVINNRVAKYKDFDTRQEADAHVVIYGGFTVHTPPGSFALDYVEVNEVAKTLFHNESARAADKAMSDIFLNRTKAYPPIQEQLNAKWEGGQAEIDMKVKVDKVLSDFPLPTP